MTYTVVVAAGSDISGSIEYWLSMAWFDIIPPSNAGLVQACVVAVRHRRGLAVYFHAHLWRLLGRFATHLLQLPVFGPHDVVRDH